MTITRQKKKEDLSYKITFRNITFVKREYQYVNFTFCNI